VHLTYAVTSGLSDATGHGSRYRLVVPDPGAVAIGLGGEAAVDAQPARAGTASSLWKPRSCSTYRNGPCHGITPKIRPRMTYRLVQALLGADPHVVGFALAVLDVLDVPKVR